jgi:hypothetical protein
MPDPTCVKWLAWPSIATGFARCCVGGMRGPPPGRLAGAEAEGRCTGLSIRIDFRGLKREASCGPSGRGRWDLFEPRASTFGLSPGLILSTLRAGFDRHFYPWLDKVCRAARQESSLPGSQSPGEQPVQGGREGLPVLGAVRTRASCRLVQHTGSA